MARRKVKVATTKQQSEAKWADEYFRQWQLAKEQLTQAEEQLAEYRKNFELKEQLIADLRAEIDEKYIAGWEQQQRCAVERIKQWVADNVAITGFDTIYTRLVNAVVWAVELKTVDNDCEGGTHG